MKLTQSPLLLLLLLSLYNFTFGQTPPPCGSLPPAQRGGKKVTISPTLGRGTETSPWVGWEGQVNATPEGSRIYLPGGFYGRTVTIMPRRGWTLEGDGKEATIILSLPGASPTAIYSLLPSNCSSAAYLVLRDIGFDANNQPNQFAAFRDNGGSSCRSRMSKQWASITEWSLIRASYLTLIYATLKVTTRPVSGTSTARV